MGRSCFMCGKKYLPGVTSLHKVPKNVELREKWMNGLMLSIEERDSLPFSATVCSDHFKPFNFYEVSKARKLLKSDAVPKLDMETPQSEIKLEDFVVSEPTDNKENLILSCEPCSRVQNVDVNTDNLQSSSFTFLTETSSESGSPYIKRENCVDEVFNDDKFETSSSNSLETDTASNFTPNYTGSKITVLSGSSSVDTTSDILFLGSQKCKKAPKHYTDAGHRRKTYDQLQTIISSQRKKIVTLQQSQRRSKVKVVSLKTQLKDLKQRLYMSKNAERIMKAASTGVPGEFFTRFIAGPYRKEYSTKLRDFAQTLNTYSPKAYNFVRETFDHCLPHLSSIQKWRQPAEGTPGFTTEASNEVRIKDEEASDGEEKSYCT